MSHQYLLRLASTGKKPRDALCSCGHVAKVSPHSSNYKGLGRALLKPFLWVKQNAD